MYAAESIHLMSLLELRRLAAILESERRDVGGQRRFVIRGLGDLALCGTMLTENPACPTLGHFQFIDDMVHASATTSGAQKFPLSGSPRARWLGSAR